MHLPPGARQRLVATLHPALVSVLQRATRVWHAVAAAGDAANNVSDYIYEKMGMNLHQQKDHPIGIIKQVGAASRINQSDRKPSHQPGWWRRWQGPPGQ